LVFGKSFEQNRLNVLRNVGSLIESPSLYGQLTSVENLRILQENLSMPEQAYSGSFGVGWSVTDGQ
jgi:ABC-2 type transport system ATP-binding protein